MLHEKKGIGNFIQDFRATTKNQLPVGWTFKCSFCGQIRELRGHKRRKGKKICRHCLLEEDND